MLISIVFVVPKTKLTVKSCVKPPISVVLKTNVFVASVEPMAVFSDITPAELTSTFALPLSLEKVKFSVCFDVLLLPFIAFITPLTFTVVKVPVTPGV